MKSTESRKSSALFVDIGHDYFEALLGEDAFSFPLERGENGRLTDQCRERLTASLRGFLSQKSRAPAREAFCAIGARGVSMRRLTLPASAPEELQQVLRLQIESEFPLSPDELAWGSQIIGPSAGAPARQEVLVVAVKKEVLEEYATILEACGCVPFFTLAALARAEIYPPPSDSCVVLDIGPTHSEWMSFENGVPSSIRILPTSSIKPPPPGQKLYLTGKSADDPQMAAMLGENLEKTRGTGPSAALAGLIKLTAKNSTAPPLLLQRNGGQGAVKLARPAVWKWAAAAVFLALGALFLPYAEAIVLKPFLERKLAALETDRGRLATIDQELDFLKFLKQNQPPYLDAIYLLARSAPSGTHFDALSMGRHQEVSMRLKLGNSQQVTDFRSKLIDSGWFGNVMVEEQTPTPDRQVNVRMSAVLKPAESRKPVAVESPGQKTEK